VAITHFTSCVVAAISGHATDLPVVVSERIGEESDGGPETVFEQGTAVAEFIEHFSRRDGIELEMSMPMAPYLDATGLDVG
jgi:hypothetical protein